MNGRKTGRSIPVKYVLYTHYSNNEKTDFEEKWDPKRKNFNELEGVKYFFLHLNKLRELLTSPAHEGMLVIFYDWGLLNFLEGIAQEQPKKELLSEPEVHFSFSVGEYIRKILKNDRELNQRVRFVTPIDLYTIFGRMHWRVLEDLRWWFIGRSNGIHYDTPKIIEAIVRLRLLGTGVPVFRLDHDVLFRNEGNKDLPDLGLFKAVVSCMKAYRLRMDEPSVATFILSASYDTSRLKLDKTKDTFDAWVGAFATRVFPSLPVIKDKIRSVSEGRITWQEYQEKEFDVELARKFYGLSESNFEVNEISGIGKLGAPPNASVISGAMLCLSEGAILDLPPFSNFTNNVIWIDDHLKYSLHRELHHLTTIELQIEPLLSDAKLDAIMVQKKRPKIPDLLKYLFPSDDGQGYLFTILWGTILDAWITKEEDVVVKFRPDDLLNKKEKTEWRSAKKRQRSGGVLALALQTALLAGEFKNKNNIRRDLIEVGLQRITKVIHEWSQLKRDDGIETFASIWAKGIVSEHFPWFDDKKNSIARIKITPKTRITRTSELSERAKEGFLTLVEDALQYIEFTINWPKIVQIVRSVEQGTVRTDLSWPKSGLRA